MTSDAYTREVIRRLLDAERRLERLEAQESGGTQYGCVAQQVTGDINGGTFTSGSWQTRTLNTVIHPASWLTLEADNQTFTLTTGIYVVQASAPAYMVNQHIAKLRRIAGGAGGADVLMGTAEYAADAYTQSRSWVIGTVEVEAAYGSEGYRVQHQCNTTKTGNGMGVRSMIATQNYTVVELWRLS